MVGNDIIDLAAAQKESNWQRKSFLQRIFTLEEQNEILNFKDPGLMVWILWSMKESAYKVFVQEEFRRLLAPLKFRCCIHDWLPNEFRGEVRFETKRYFTFSRISWNKISATAYSLISSRNNFITGDVEFSGDIQCKNELLLNFFAGVSAYIEKPAGDLSIIKDKLNIPYLCFKGEHLKSSISFSHHGRYGAYAAEFL